MQAIVVAILIISQSVCAMEQSNNNNENNDFYTVVVPGEPGYGCFDLFRDDIINTDSDHTYQVPLDYYAHDLGQSKSEDNLDSLICDRFGPGYMRIRGLPASVGLDSAFGADAYATKPKMLLYGVGQGASTLINWLARESHEGQEARIQGLVLESVIGSGESALAHMVKNTSSVVKSIPGHAYWLPSVIKYWYFHKYDAQEDQAINSAKKISPNIPVILIHNSRDKQLPINDARALYCVLREKNDNVYLFETNLAYPMNNGLLKYDRAAHRKIAAIQAIYKKYGLPYNQDIELPQAITEFQPPINTVRLRISSQKIAELAEVAQNMNTLR